MRILIVDDEPMSLQETKNVSQNAKPEAEIITAENYKKALLEAKDQKIDIAILDIEMPGMNGLELAKKLKDICSDTNIIFATAYSEYALDAFSLYASGYLLKPLKPESLREALHNLRIPVQYSSDRLQVQCFGNFEVFYNGRPLHFSRTKAKELFAYLIDLRGAAANT
ncbi:MAG: response regulator, partial [Clostridia bacterium]|nr:response regulator [Clostridia bacterium]